MCPAQPESVKPSLQRLQQPARQRAAALVETRLLDLFERLPMLCGFCVGRDLDVADVAIHSWPGYMAGEDLYLEIANSLVDLLEERPETIELLRGRTFARAFH